jgi:hypothetical protein
MVPIVMPAGFVDRPCGHWLQVADLFVPKHGCILAMQSVRQREVARGRRFAMRARHFDLRTDLEVGPDDPGFEWHPGKIEKTEN